MTVELPEEMIGEMCREQAKLDGDLWTSPPDGLSDDKVNVWDIITDMDLVNAKVAHNDDVVYCEYDGGSITFTGRRVNRGDRWNPPAYEEIIKDVIVFINWDLDPTNQPEVIFEYH